MPRAAPPFRRMAPASGTLKSSGPDRPCPIPASTGVHPTMSQLPAIHLAIMQPAGYVHSLGFLDQARYFRHQFRRLGATVTMAKNRLREDAVNFVFGAHLGFPADWQERHARIFLHL